MHERLALLGPAAAFLLGFAICPAAADDRAACLSQPTTDASVPACTRLIESGEARGPDLYKFYAWRCLHFRSRNDYDRASADANAAIRLDKLSAPAFLCGSEASYRKRDYDGAIRDATEALRLDPANGIAYILRGNSHYQKGNYDSAIADMTEAIPLRPADARPYVYRARSYYRQDQYGAALADLENAIRVNPRSEEAYDGRAHIYYGLGDDEKAIDDETEAIRLKPRSGRFYNARGLFYQQTGDIDRAITDLNQAILLDPALAAAYANRGDVHRQQGELDRAVIDLTKALILDPKITPALTRRGLAFEQGGDLARARADYNDALARQPGNFISLKWAVDTATQRLSALSGTRVESGAASSHLLAPIGGLAVGTSDRVAWLQDSTTSRQHAHAFLKRVARTATKPAASSCLLRKIARRLQWEARATIAAGRPAPTADRQEEALLACSENGGRDSTVRRSICDGQD